MNEHTSHNEQRIPAKVTEETTTANETVNEGHERWLDVTQETEMKKQTHRQTHKWMWD